MKNYKYILQPYTDKYSRFTCPKCGKSHQFTKYIDQETGEILADHVGICNRINNCCYHYTPKQYFEANGTDPKMLYDYISKPKQEQNEINYIDQKTYQRSLQGYEQNMLVKYLHTLFDSERVYHLLNIYKIGTSSRYGGGTTIFWQIDEQDNIRTGKLIKYNNKGHRVHGKQNWAHSVLDIKNFKLSQCLFGEHLLKYDTTSTIGIVESEKTAVIACGYFPDLLWLSTGGAQGMNLKKAKVLFDRDVILFPDASPDSKIYNKWEKQAEQFGFKISNYLEQYTTDEQKSKGVDIADFF